MSRPARGQESFIEKMIIDPAREALAAVSPRPLVCTQILREAAWVIGEQAKVAANRGSREGFINVENIAAWQNRAHQSAVFRRRQDHAPIDWRSVLRGAFNQVLEDERRGAEPV